MVPNRERLSAEGRSRRLRVGARGCHGSTPPSVFYASEPMSTAAENRGKTCQLATFVLHARGVAGPLGVLLRPASSGSRTVAAAGGHGCREWNPVPEDCRAVLRRSVEFAATPSGGRRLKVLCGLHQPVRTQRQLGGVILIGRLC